jgi:hypothetical protein
MDSAVIAAFHLNKGATIKDAKAPPIRRAIANGDPSGSKTRQAEVARETARIENGLLLKQFEMYRDVSSN